MVSRAQPGFIPDAPCFVETMRIKSVNKKYKAKRSDFSMLIAIDHGNKQMKTIHRTFTSALKESDTRPPFGEDVLEYKGKF